MEFYEVIDRRRTVREFSDREVPYALIEKMIEAGFKAPTNDHRRDWEFIVLHTPEEKEKGLSFVRDKAAIQAASGVIDGDDDKSRMYAYAVPRQYRMLYDAQYVILPFFKAAPKLFEPVGVNSFNTIASIWCVNENMFLAAAAEGLGTSMRIPIGDEAEKVRELLGVPEGYVLSCYIGVGYPAENRKEVKQFDIPFESRIHRGEW